MAAFSTLSRLQGVTFNNTVIVKSEDDFPPLNGSNQHPLAADTFYRIDGDISVAYNFLLPSSGNVAFGGGSIPDTLTYTGGGTMFVQPAHAGGSFFLDRMIVKGNNTATLYDITDTSGTLEVVWTTFNALDFASLGTLNAGSIAGNYTTHGNYGAPLDCTVKSDAFMAGSIFYSSGSSSGMILRMGEDTIAQVVINTPFIGATENWLNVPATANDFRMIVTGNLSPETTGNLFDPSGLNHTDPRIEVRGNVGFPDSDIIGAYVWSRNTTDTTITVQGMTYSITSFADAGGGFVTATTSASHVITNGEDVSISGNSGYDGYHTVSNVTATTFDFPATFVATGTGVVTNGWTKIGGTTFAYSGNERASMTDNNQVTFTNLANHRGLATVSITAERGTSGSGAPTFELILFKNGTPDLIGGQEVISKIDTTVGTPRNSPFSPPTTTIKDDIFELYCRNVTNTSDFKLTDGQVTIT